MPFIDTQRYELFDYMHPEIPEGGQRPEIPHKLITNEVLHGLVRLNFEMMTWTLGNILSFTCKRCSHIPFQGTYSRALEHLAGWKNPGSSRAGVSGCERRLQRQRRNIYVEWPQQVNMRRGANILYRKFLLVPCPHHPMLPHFSFLLFFHLIHCTRHPRL